MDPRGEYLFFCALGWLWDLLDPSVDRQLECKKNVVGGYALV